MKVELDGIWVNRTSETPKQMPMRWSGVFREYTKGRKKK